MPIDTSRLYKHATIVQSRYSISAFCALLGVFKEFEQGDRMTPPDEFEPVPIYIIYSDTLIDWPNDDNFVVIVVLKTDTGYRAFANKYELVTYKD